MPPEETFWNFSCRVYAQEGVPASCLALQDTHEQDVNLLLFALWHAHTRGTLPPTLLQEALDFSLPWRAHVVGPLRHARVWLKFALSAPENQSRAEALVPLRERIKAVELQSEKWQQEALDAMVKTSAQTLSPSAQRIAARENLHALVSAQKQDMSIALTGALEELIGRVMDPAHTTAP